MKTITAREFIQKCISAGAWEASDEHLGNANIHRPDIDALEVELTAFAEAYHAQKEADKVKLKGKIIEIGNLEDGIGRGIRLESNGEFIELVGMTEDECREAVKWFTQEVEITIALPPLPIAKD